MTTDRDTVAVRRKDKRPKPTQTLPMFEEIIRHKPSAKEFEQLVHRVLNNGNEEALVG